MRQKPPHAQQGPPATPPGVTDSSLVHSLAPDPSRTLALGCHLQIPEDTQSTEGGVRPQLAACMLRSRPHPLHLLVMSSGPRGIHPSDMSQTQKQTWAPRMPQACAHLSASNHLTPAGLHTEPIPTGAPSPPASLLACPPTSEVQPGAPCACPVDLLAPHTANPSWST